MTLDERDQLFTRWEDETLLVMDARRLGLDHDDPIVRRRLEEKMRYLLEDAASSGAASDDALRAHLSAYPERFMLPERVSLEQRFFSRAARGAHLDADAQAALSMLRAGEDAEGDKHPLGDAITLSTESAVRRSLGRVVAARLGELEVERWSGPFASRAGLHLSLIHI